MKNNENDDDAAASVFVDYTGKQGLSDHTSGSTANNTLGRSAITLYSALMIIFLSSGNNTLWFVWTANNTLQRSELLNLHQLPILIAQSKEGLLVVYIQCKRSAYSNQQYVVVTNILSNGNSAIKAAFYHQR